MAHRISAIFGVDIGEAPAGQTWVANYGDLTAGEIARGGLLPSRSWHSQVNAGTKAPLGDSHLLPKGTFWIADHALVRGTGPEGEGIPGAIPVAGGVHEIAPATLGRFGPDRKAALVLAGSNEAFASLNPVFEDVVRLVLLRQPELDRRMKVMLWALMVLETYRSQPALFAAAVQARAIQRALTMSWGPVAGGRAPAARGEFGSPDVAQPQVTDGDLEPRELNVLDQALEWCLGAKDADAYSRDELISRWTRYLLESPDRGVVWVTEPSPGNRQCEVLLSTNDSVRSFTGDMLPQGGAQTQARLSDPEKWRHLCPVVPKPEELIRLSKKSQVAVIWCLVQMFRNLRDDPSIEDEPFRRHITEQLEQVSKLSADVLGPAHQMTYFAFGRHAAALQRDLRRTDPQRSLEAGLDVNRSTARLAELREAGQVSGGFYAETLVSASMSIRLAMEDAAARGSHELAGQIEGYLSWLWEEVFSTVGLDLDEELENARQESTSPLLKAFAPYVHNYARFLADLESPSARRRAMDLIEHVVIPSREAVARTRGTERPLRLSLQVALHIIDSLLALEDVDGYRGDRQSLAQQASDHVQRLIAMPHVQQTLAGQQLLTTSRAATLHALLKGWLIGLENETTEMTVNVDQVRQQLDRLAHFFGVDLSAAPEAPSAPQLDILGLRDRLMRAVVLTEAQDILAHSAFATHPQPLAQVRGDQRLAEMRGAQDVRPEGKRWTIEVPDAQVFTALRGSPRRYIDRWPTLELTWTGEAGGRLGLVMHQPRISAAVSSVTVRLTVGNSVYNLPLSWEDRPDHPIVLHGALTGVTLPKFDEVPVKVEVTVRGRGF